MEKNQNKTYWPQMILGFLAVGITLGYWTVKSASSMPVQQENEFMLSYQMADMNINEIIERKKAFDAAYKINLVHAETMVMTDNINSNRVQPDSVKLSQGENTFDYQVVTSTGENVTDANVTFLLTRPHTRTEDMTLSDLPYADGVYRAKTVMVTKPGRYTLQLKVQVGDAIGYSQIPAYLKP